MKTLFTVLSVLLVVVGLLSLIGDATTVGIALLAIGMAGIAIRAYGK